MKILVLGGGAQGRVIAADLARSLPHEVSVADVRKPSVPASVKWVEADASDRDALARLIAGYDLAVGALPSRYGFGGMEAAIEAGKPVVDVSFAGEDPLKLDQRARAKGVAIAVDCGLAPGLSHLLCGDMYEKHGAPEMLEILVGG